LISESSGGKRPRDKIELDRFGRPVVGSGGALTAKKLRTLDKAVHDDSDSDGTMDTCTSRASTLRPRDETAEQRRLRKAAVRAERRERRVEKKANTIAFKVSAYRLCAHTFSFRTKHTVKLCNAQRILKQRRV
jgi:protein LTV1